MIVNRKVLKGLKKELPPNKYRLKPTSVIEVYEDAEDDGMYELVDVRYVLPDRLAQRSVRTLHAGENSELRIGPLPNDGMHDGNNGVRTVLNIVGVAGKGKSFLSMKYARSYRQRFPERYITIISPTADSPQIEEYGIFVIRGNDESAHSFFVNSITRLTPGDFINQLVIFDDIESYADKKVAKGVAALRDELLCNGRHTGTSVIICGHTLLGGAETKKTLSECNYLCYFMNGTELSKKEKDAIDRVCPGAVKKINAILESEGVPPRELFIIHKSAPSFVMTYNDMYMI